MGRRVNPAAPGNIPGRRRHAGPGPGGARAADPSAAGAGAAPGVSHLAGYRVVRRLGSGRRAVTYLGHAGPRERVGTVTRPVTVALKVFDPAADPASIEREVRALSRSPARALPGLLDVATLPDGRVCLILERLTGASLNRHLATIDRIRPGEAVTILAPIVAALSALHEAGFAHEGLSPASVLFAEDGRPVLAGLGGLRDLPPAGVARIPALRSGYLRIGQLLRAVLDRLEPDDPAVPAAGRLADWFDDASIAVPFRPCLDELERRLFGWAEATPIRAPGAHEAAGAAVRPRAGRAALRIEMGADPASPPVTPAPVGAAGPRQRPRTLRQPAGRLLALHLPPEVRSALEGALDALGGHAAERALARLRARARRHPRPLLLAAALAAGLVLLAIGALPEGNGPAGFGADAASPQFGDGRATDGARDGTAPDGAGAGAGSAATSDPAVPDPAAPDLAALSGDEPALAVPVLLRRRAGCLAAASVVCLDGVDQPGSTVMAGDTFAVRSAQQGGGPADARTFERHAASLVERTGNSALVALAPPTGPEQPTGPGQPPDSVGPVDRPVSVLVVRGESGWRLREIFDY